MANREMRSSLSHRFSREAFFSDLTANLNRRTKSKPKLLPFSFLPALSLNLFCSVRRK